MIKDGGICTPWNNKFKWCPLHIDIPKMSSYKMHIKIETALYWQPLTTKLEFCGEKGNCETLYNGDIREFPVLTDFDRTYEKERIAGDKYHLACNFRSTNGLGTVGSTIRCTCNVNLTPNGENTIEVSQMGSSLRGPVSCSQHFADSEGKTVQPSEMDLDNNGVINTLDMIILNDAYGKTSNSSKAQDVANKANPDINNDGLVNALDLSYLIDAFGITIKSN
jgi:hypothetical protein